MIGAGRAELFGQAALEAQGRELCDQFDDEHGKGETPHGFGAVPTPRDIKKGQARDEAQDESEEIGASALGKRGGIGVAQFGVGAMLRLGRARSSAVGLAQAPRPF